MDSDAPDPISAGQPVIARCTDEDFRLILAIINDAAQAYRDVIPGDRWHDPYMTEDQLRQELRDGVVFWGVEEDGRLTGVMGIQQTDEQHGPALIRHAYVSTADQHRGIGGRLLTHLRAQTSAPFLVGTWADAQWAVRFYERRGFRIVTAGEKNRLLRRYWSVPERQIETSVVLADERWFEAPRPDRESA
ncbi:MAG TPA: GNAT family N-acetyltransferase [Dehalococcoidia bacterium]|nr:GNAT family N-acetyltransferase [Dehalococcoidia bacterium]